MRSSRPEVFHKKGVLRNFAKFTGKHLSQSLFLNKFAGLIPSLKNTCQRLLLHCTDTTLLKKRLWHRCFPVNFAKFLRTPFFTEQLRWVLLCSFQCTQLIQYISLKSEYDQRFLRKELQLLVVTYFFRKASSDICFSMEMIIYTLNIKATVTWYLDFYGCQGYKKKVITKRKN